MDWCTDRFHDDVQLDSDDGDERQRRVVRVSRDKRRQRDPSTGHRHRHAQRSLYAAHSSAGVTCGLLLTDVARNVVCVSG